MSRGPAPGDYWSLPARRQPRPPEVVADSLGVTFPVLSHVAKDIDAESKDRMIWDKQGRLRGVRALEDISFELKQGNRLAIIGSNGSGKTTLLQVLAGILPPETGTLTTRGRITSLINIHLGMQPEASGHRNITLRGLAAGYTHEMIEAKRAEIVEFSELGEFLDMPIHTYSAGMQMRLSFSIATAFDPEILILDEWLSAGDTAFGEKANKRMKEFVEKAGILILASHSRSLILQNCDKAIWLKHGRIVEEGEARAVLDAYEGREPEPEAVPEPAPAQAAEVAAEPERDGLRIVVSR